MTAVIDNPVSTWVPPLDDADLLLPTITPEPRRWYTGPEPTPTPKPRDLGELLTLLDKIAWEFPPGHTNPVFDQTRCRFTDNGRPSCLVGHLLHRLGVSIRTLEHLDNGSGEWVTLFSNLGMSFASAPMNSAINLADNGAPWREVTDHIRYEDAANSY